MRRSIAGLLVLSTAGFGCGGGSGATTTSRAATTTTAVATATTTTEATTTTPAPSVVFTEEDLPAAVLADGDPWVVPIVGTQQFPLTLDDIWPIERFPEERPIYETAGFEAGSFAAFIEEALVITGAHLFADATGAAIAFDLIESSFMDTELIAEITDLDPGALTSVESLESSVGDRSAAVLATGPDFQVVGVIWIQGNLLQFVRIGMAAGDDARQEAAFELAEALAARVAGG